MDGIKGMLRQQLKSLVARAALCSLLPFLVSSSVLAQGWERVKLPIDETVTGLSFISPDTGYIVTSGAKYARTFDGCKTWKFYTIRKDSSFEDVCFLNKDTGMICGSYGTIYRTIDGCKNWDAIWLPDPNDPVWLTSVLLLPGRIGLMVGLVPGNPPSSEAFRSEDGGRTWTKLPAMGLAYGELFYRSGDPICFQSWGKLNYSMDKGKTWSSMKVPSVKPTRATSFFKNTGVLCGNSGAVACTIDRGKTWKTVEQNSGINFTAALLVDEETGYIAGTGGSIFKTTDAGTTWQAEKLPVSVDFAGLYQVGDYVYACGADGVILRTKIKSAK